MQEIITGVRPKKVTASTVFDPMKQAPDSVLSNGNRSATFAPTGNSCMGLVGHNTGKWYLEMKATKWESAGNQFPPLIGIGTDRTSLVNTYFTGQDALAIYGSTLIYGPVNRLGYAMSITVGGTVGMAVDFDAGTFYFIDSTGTRRTVLNLATYTAGTGLFYPLASSPKTNSAYTSGVELVQNQLYTPSGYLPW